MELLWQNGQVVMQIQNQRSFKKSQASKSPIEDAVPPQDQSKIRSSAPVEDFSAQLFMHEDEMASWLHYPIDDFYADLMEAEPCVRTSHPPSRSICTPDVRQPHERSAAAKPPIPPARRAELHSFLHCTRIAAAESGLPSSSRPSAMESTVVDSSVTPAACQQSRTSPARWRMAEFMSSGDGSFGCATAGSTSAAGDHTTCELTMTSSPGRSCSGATADAEQMTQQAAEDRKRKGREGEEAAECQSEVSFTMLS